MAQSHRIVVDPGVAPTLGALTMEAAGLGPGATAGNRAVRLLSWTSYLLFIGVAGLAIAVADGWFRVAAVAMAIGCVVLQTVSDRLSHEAMVAGVDATRIYGAPLTFTIGTDGLAMEGSGAAARFPWALVDDVMPLSRGVAIFVGGGAFVVPDAALPAGLTRAQLLADVARWRGGSPV